MPVLPTRCAALAAVAAALALAAPTVRAEAPPPAAVPVPAFDPVAFFSGATEGRGKLNEVMAAPKATHVVGRGALRSDGTMVIDQTVAIAGDPVKTRQWRLRRTAPGRFAGTLSDASGPVSAAVAGARLTIRYKMAGGMAVEQVLTLAADGQSARNRMRIRKFGLVVATLDEVIRRVR